MMHAGPDARRLFAFEHTPDQAEFDRFATISGDDNPIHVDPAFSARTRFGRTVAHGMLLYTLFWARLRDALPQAVMREQSLKFPHPAYAGERLFCEASIEPLGEGMARVTTRMTRAADGEPVCEAMTVLDLAGAA